MNQNEKHAQQEEERRRERPLRLKFLLPGGRVSKEGAVRPG
jgi:hypothetical protein